MGFSGKNPTDSSPTIVSEKGIPNKSTTKPQPTPPQVIFWKNKINSGTWDRNSFGEVDFLTDFVRLFMFRI